MLNLFSQIRSNGGVLSRGSHKWNIGLVHGTPETFFTRVAFVAGGFRNVKYQYQL